MIRGLVIFVLLIALLEAEAKLAEEPRATLPPMSWSLSTDVHPAEDIRSALDHTQPPAHLSEHQLKQVRAAKEAAEVLLNEEAVGEVNTLAEGNPHFKVILSGHRDDDPDADAQVSVTVSKVQPPNSD